MELEQLFRAITEYAWTLSPDAVEVDLVMTRRDGTTKSTAIPLRLTDWQMPRTTGGTPTAPPSVVPRTTARPRVDACVQDVDDADDADDDADADREDDDDSGGSARPAARGRPARPRKATSHPTTVRECIRAALADVCEPMKGRQLAAYILDESKWIDVGEQAVVNECTAMVSSEPPLLIHIKGKGYALPEWQGRPGFDV